MNAFSCMTAGLLFLGLLDGCADPNRNGVASDTWRMARVDRDPVATQHDVEPIDGGPAADRLQKTQALADVASGKEAMGRRSVLFFPVRLPVW